MQTYLFKQAASQHKNIKTKMMTDMISGVVVVKSASMADETIPLPYCSEPMSAFALPFIS